MSPLHVETVRALRDDADLEVAQAATLATDAARATCWRAAASRRSASP